MNTSVSDMLNTFNEKIHNLNNKSLEIFNKFEDGNFVIDNNKLELILNISQNLNLLNDQLDDLKDIVLETANTNNLTLDEKQQIRANKIDKKINELFLPYIIYTKICLENNI
jgi:hypothetical protein